jgi:alpha-beta hydrolase superfamily lysophospholipase
MPDGTELSAVTWTHPDPKGTILIIHGISEHAGRWGHVAEFFVEEGFEVHSYDQRAHGESGSGVLHIEDFNHYVDDIATTIADIRVPGRPLIIYGHSMGGLIVALYAESENEQPDAVVLSAPALSSKAIVPTPLRVAAKVLGRLVPRFAVASPVEEAHLSRDPDVGQAYIDDPLVYLKGTARFGLEFANAMDRGGADIHKIRVPTLVVHGADDVTVPPHVSAPLAAVDGVERRVFPGLRHEMHNEPEQREVLGFISRWLQERLSR